MSLKNQHTVITGAGSGIGAAIAHHLAAEGANLTLMGRRKAPLDSVKSELPLARSICCDVTDADQVSLSFAEAVAEAGPVDILINNAGIAPTAAFHKMDYTQWREVMALNLDGVFLCSKAVIDTMLERKYGRIVNIASTAALKGYAYVSAYTAAKHGVLGLTRALALETAEKGITVNAVCPGYTDTEIIRKSIKEIVDKTGRSEEEAMLVFTSTNPQKRLIQVDEVADTVAWLCKDSSRSITGQAISVSGGEVMTS
jgi:NAD(P)-dependent dehydrogenase (short-subunit alcohol dehydrogenase family)